METLACYFLKFACLCYRHVVCFYPYLQTPSKGFPTECQFWSVEFFFFFNLPSYFSLFIYGTLQKCCNFECLYAVIFLAFLSKRSGRYFACFPEPSKAFAIIELYVISWSEGSRAVSISQLFCINNLDFVLLFNHC